MGFACLKPVHCLGPALVRGALSSTNHGRLRCAGGRWTPLRRQQALHTHAGGPPSMSSPATQWAQQLSKEKPLTVLEGRERLRELIPAEALRIAGVTFEGRQELIAALQPGLPPFAPAPSQRPPHAAASRPRMLFGDAPWCHAGAHA